MARFRKSDFAADRFSLTLDAPLRASAERFDGDGALSGNAAPPSHEATVSRDKARAARERGFRVPESGSRDRAGPLLTS